MPLVAELDRDDLHSTGLAIQSGLVERGFNDVSNTVGFSTKLSG
jgi:hypothetical protein